MGELAQSLLILITFAAVLAGSSLWLHARGSRFAASLPIVVMGVVLLWGMADSFGMRAEGFMAPHALGLVMGGIALTALAAQRRWRRASPGRARTRGVVLAIGAHPDDIEFGCGAALLRYREDGYETHGLVLSQGEVGLALGASSDIGLRRREAVKAAKIISLDTLTVLNFPDTRLTSRRDQIRMAIEDSIRRCDPLVVFTHTRADTHSDHRLVYSATVEACRNVPTVLCYENPNTPPEFKPNLFVDISDALNDKIRALRCHSSQARKPYFKPDLIRSMARMRGNQGRVRFAEAFEVIRARVGDI